MPDPPPPSTLIAAPVLTRQEKAFTLAGIMLGLLLGALDQTIVSTAGPEIQRDLAIPTALYAWITISYLVASTVFVPIYGKLSDLMGRKPVLLFGIVLFLIGSLLCGSSQTTVQLILARAVQGMGSASLFTSAFAVIADMFSPAERGRYNALFASVFALASVIGPLVGGFITDHFGWHWVFFINLPLGAIAVTFIALKMPRLGRSRWHDPDRPRVDIGGTLTLALCVVPLLVALSLGRTSVSLTASGHGFLWTSPEILGLFTVTVVGLVAFLWTESRAHDPILDLHLFRNPAFAWGNLATFISGASFLSAIVFLPLFMVNVIGLSATRSGLTVTPLTFGIVFGNIAAGHLVSRIGRYKPLLLGGLLILMGAFALMGFTLSSQSSQAEVTLKMVLVGIGLGPAISLYPLAIQNSVESRLLGVATSSATFFRQMGSTMGVAVLGTVFATELATEIHEGVAMNEAFTRAISEIYRIGILIAALGFLVTLKLPELPLRKSTAREVAR